VGKTIAVTNYDDRAQFYYNDTHANLLDDTVSPGGKWERF
jgi:hypothetical protein